MSPKAWLALNSGNLLHYNIPPPGDTPEEIAEWIAARKRRWPTARNVANREKEKQEKWGKVQEIRENQRLEKIKEIIERKKAEERAKAEKAEREAEDERRRREIEEQKGDRADGDDNDEAPEEASSKARPPPKKVAQPKRKQREVQESATAKKRRLQEKPHRKSLYDRVGLHLKMSN